MNSIFIIAHQPLASALRDAALHIFPDASERILALDVLAHDAPECSLNQAQELLKCAGMELNKTLIVCDLFGATPCNVAQKLLIGSQGRLLTGANLPMLLRALTYANSSLSDMLASAQAGASQGIIHVGPTAPQNQNPSVFPNDKHHHYHQQ